MEKTVFYSFPEPERLASIKDIPQSLGLGYRVKFILESSREIVAKGGREYLRKLRDEMTPTEKRNELLKLQGVGPKVADCVSLYSLDCHNYVPLDTHMLQLYKNVYQSGKGFSITKFRAGNAKNGEIMQYGGSKNYDQIEAFFVDLLTSEEDRQKIAAGESIQGYAGIAHSFMFTKKIGMKGAETEIDTKDKSEGKSLQQIDQEKGTAKINLKKKSAESQEEFLESKILKKTLMNPKQPVKK